jgi:hypothetical protein
VSERFAAVPLRFVDALRLREVSADEFALGCWLVAEAGQRGEVATTLAAVREMLGWECGPDTVARRLRKLAEEGWLECHATPGRAGWTVRLVALKLRDSSAHPPQLLRTEGASRAEFDLLTDLRTPSGGEAREAVSETGPRASEAPHETPHLARAGEDETRRDTPAPPVLRTDISALSGSSPTPKQERRLAEAEAESPEGFARLVADARAARNVRSQVALLVSKVEQGAHLRPVKRQPQVCPECEVGAGRHAADCSRARAAG